MKPFRCRNAQCSHVYGRTDGACLEFGVSVLDLFVVLHVERQTRWLTCPRCGTRRQWRRRDVSASETEQSTPNMAYSC